MQRQFNSNGDQGKNTEEWMMTPFKYPGAVVSGGGLNLRFSQKLHRSPLLMDHVTNEDIHWYILATVGQHYYFLTMVKEKELTPFGHSLYALAKTILHGKLKGKTLLTEEKMLSRLWKSRPWLILPGQLGQLDIENQVVIDYCNVTSIVMGYVRLV